MRNVDFDIDKRTSKTKHQYSEENLDLAYEFTKKIHRELGEVLKAVILFGSTARKEEDANDIDILLIADDVTINFSKELVQTYRVIVEQKVRETSDKIHVTSMKLTSFWEYIRNGDPIALNILRDGFALIDTGFFDPLQLMLRQGRIKPSKETQWNYFQRAPQNLDQSQQRMKDAMIDLYWAVIDASHAALMSINEIPPTPKHVPEYLDEKLVQKGLIKEDLPWTVRRFYDLHKRISNEEIRTISGEEYDKHYRIAKEFVEEIQDFIE